MLFLSSRRNAFLYFPPAAAISASSGFVMKQPYGKKNAELKENIIFINRFRLFFVVLVPTFSVLIVMKFRKMASFDENFR
jgi:heme/copper-type cytochrome/quinol oxidase subunit 2